MSPPRRRSVRCGSSITRPRRPGRLPQSLPGRLFQAIPPGYYPFVFDDAQYYGYYDLPLGYQQIVVDGVVYYLFNGVYYQAYMYDGQTVYLAVPAPV